MINCLIIDDEQHAIDILTVYAGKTPLLNLVASTTNPVQGLQIITAQQIDLVFLDIQMPDLNGIDFIKAIKGKCKVILTTAYSEFALQGYELDVMDYLLKPIPFPRFLAAVQKVHDLIIVAPSTTASINIADDFIFVKSGIKGKVDRINLIDIDYIESLKGYACIYHGTKKTLVYIGMKDLEAQLPPAHFLRVHKSYIVPVSRITGVEGNKILLKNIKADIILGDTYRQQFLSHINNKIIGR